MVWEAALSSCDAVFHVAGRAHVMQENQRHALSAYRAVNVDLTRHVLEVAAAVGCRTFVFASSVKAVGEQSTLPYTEDSVPAPVDPYGQSKLEAERIVAERGRELGVRTASLRFPLMYGPGMRANMLQLFRAVARGVPLPLAGIDNRRSILFVGNAVAALEAAAGSGAAQGVYFVSDDEDPSTPELIRAIARALDRPARLIPVPLALLRLAGRLGDGLAPWLRWPVTSGRIQRLMGTLQVDSGRFRREVGFVPPYSLDAGMVETARWFAGLSKEIS
jgi:UDP-glucose 4-epimerase